jgi:hypothetical protein
VALVRSIRTARRNDRTQGLTSALATNVLLHEPADLCLQYCRISTQQSFGENWTAGGTACPRSLGRLIYGEPLRSAGLDYALSAPPKWPSPARSEKRTLPSGLGFIRAYAKNCRRGD